MNPEQKIKHIMLTDHMVIWTAADTEKKSGRGRSSANAASVYGIKKLRELILELAVRGKLVPQDSKDEPAIELLKRIQAEKSKLIAEGKIRKGQPLPVITEQEETFNLPHGWDWVRLGQIGDWGAGATPLRSVSSYYGGKTPWFKSGELTADFIDTSEETITELALKECSLRLNQPGDVLIAMYGATIGKTSILKLPGTTNQAVCACTPYAGIFNRYLLVLLKAMKPNFIGQGAGGAQPNISREKIIATIVAMPPTDEQHRIVAKVDELMALCDQLETQHNNAAEAHEKLVSHLLGTLTQSQSADELTARDGGNAENAGAIFGEDNWQRIAAHFDTLFTTESSIDQLKQTLLQLAVMGKLVPQNPNDEPASELLKRMQAERIKLIAEGKIKKDKPLSPITDDEMPFDLPHGWAWVRLGEALDIVGGVTLGKRNMGMDCINLPYLRVANVQRGHLLLDSIKTVEIKKSELTKYRLENDDLLVTEGGDWDKVGRTAIWRSEIEFCLHQNHIFRMRCLTKGLSSLWVEMYMNSAAKEYFQAASKQTTNLASINMTQLKNCLLAVPALHEQRLIVSKVDELMSLCDKLKSRITEAKNIQIHISNVIVEQAVV